MESPAPAAAPTAPPPREARSLDDPPSPTTPSSVSASAREADRLGERLFAAKRAGQVQRWRVSGTFGGLAVFFLVCGCGMTRAQGP